MQDIIQMCSSFDASKSTKGASKLRRDLINTEIGHLRDLLPLPASTRQRLSQLQLMALVCVYVRKANYFQQVFKRHDLGQMPTPSIGFSKAMNGFLMMMTQNGKLLYISDNAAEYLGHSMEDLLIHGDSVYDIIDKQDHQSVQNELARAPAGVHDDARLFLCRMNVSRNARRQMRFGDQKVILVEGHFVSYLPLCTRNEPVLIATCTPVAMPETRECVVQGATNIFTSVHSMDMKFASIDASGEFYLGYSRQELLDVSWYQLLHWDYMREAQSKHRLITQSEQDRSCILLVRLQRRNGTWLWIHCVLQVKDASEAGQQPVIVCTNQVLSEREAQVMRANSWLYHYYLVQTKLQYGMNYEGQQASAGTSRSSAASASSPGGASFGYQPAANINSPGPSSTCSASGETPTTPQPAFQQPQQLVPAPIASPLYAPPPPPPHHLHPHGHLYAVPSDGYHHFPVQQAQHQPSAPGSYAFSPGHHQGYLGGSFQNSYHHLHALPAHQQAHLIKSESFGAAEPAELGVYQVKAETKLDEYNSPVVDAGGAMYGNSVNSVKEEPNGEPGEDPASPVSSPPRKRYRLMATSLPSIGPPSFPPNGGPGSEHHPGHHGDQTQHHQQDWHRNHRSDHHPGYGQWPSTGWINSSYPVGLTQLDDAGYETQEHEDTFSPLVSLTATSSPSSPVRIHQRRSLQRRKQYAVEAPSSTGVIRHRLVESVQRVPDVSATMLPELSPLGYVLTPAPTPPDTEEPASICFPAEGSLAETEQRVPVSDVTGSCVGPVHYAAPGAQAAEHPLLMTLPAISHHYVYQAENGAQSVSSFQPGSVHRNDVTQDQQEPKTPPSMHSL